jgi:choline dehydrogenase-like flavoprotein
VSNQLPTTDVAIIGLGAAGGIAASVLTEAGLNVVGLEAGPRLDHDDFHANDDEISGTILNWTGEPKFNQELPTSRPDANSPTAPPVPPVKMANMVGGTSIHCGKESWRFRADDFAVRTDTIEKYGEDALPPGSTTVDWPVTFDELDGDNFDHEGLGFIRGAVLFASNGDLPIAKSRSLAPGTPAWGSDYKRWIHENSDSAGQVFAQVEPQPYEGNFLDLDPDVKDPMGVLVVRVTYSLCENEINAAMYINERIVEMLEAAGATETWSSYPPDLPLPINSHAYGGTRMADDESGGVVDKHGLAFEAPNLMVPGGSTFPGSSGYNRTETIQAHAWFAAEYLAENFQTIAV